MYLIRHFQILNWFIPVILVVGCSSRPPFDELAGNDSSALNVYTHSSTEMNYSISLPTRFKFADKEYNDSMNFELFVDTSMQIEMGASMLSVLEYNSRDTIIEEAWNNLLSNRVMFENFRIYSEGVTDYLPRPAYYEHSACTINEKNRESISFLFRGDSSNFYLANLQVNTGKGYSDNMKELLYSAKSIKIVP